MPVVFKCECGSYLSVSRKNIGKRVVCPECEEIQNIPDPNDSRAVRLTQQESKRLKGGDVSTTKQMVRQRMRAEQVPGTEEKKKKKKKKKKKTLDVPEDSAFASAILETEAATIGLNCFCGRQFSVEADKAGQSIECEQCGREITVPDPSKAQDIELAPLDEEDEKCPFCGSSVSASELACHSCGKGLTASRKYDS